MRGLLNLGNTCYFNSAIQALAHVPQLSNRLIRDPPFKGTCEITREYQKVIRQIWTTREPGPVDPSALLAAFRARFRSFANNGQHDAQEVILAMIDVLESSLGHEFIRGIFNGVETQETVFPGGKSSRDETFTTVLVHGASLEDEPAWKTLNGYTDDHGQTHNVAAVRTTVSRWPSVPIVTFVHAGRAPEQLPSGHRLFAAVIHHGSYASGGHYATAVRRKGAWFLKDDDAVQSLTESPGACYVACYA